MNNLLGIIQGRLSKSPKNRLQYFPKKWENEFSKAKRANYDYIEFFSERKFNKQNPIWDNFLINKYKNLAKKNNLKIINFCDDYVINNDLRKKKTIKYSIKLLRQVKFLGARNFILPLYGASEINKKNLKTFIKPFKKIIKFTKKNKINLLLETNLSFKEYNNFLNFFENEKIYLVFDTGNRVIKNRDLSSEIIQFKKYLKLVHIKNRDKFYKNSLLNGGLVNFTKVFNALKNIKYKGNFTIESTRTQNPFNIAKKNARKINYLIKKKLK